MRKLYPNDARKAHYPKKKLLRRTYQISRITMEGTLGRRLRRDEVVHHIDGDIRNNSPENLCVLLRSEYSRFHRLGVRLSATARIRLSLAHNPDQRGSMVGTAKLDETRVAAIKAAISRGMKIPDIAAAYSAGKTTIYDIYMNRTWRHVPWPEEADSAAERKGVSGAGRAS